MLVFTNIIVILKNLITFPLNQSILLLSNFFNDLVNFNNLKTEKEKVNVYDNASELYNDYLKIQFDQYYELSDAKREKLSPNMILIIYFLRHIIMMSDLKMNND